MHLTEQIHISNDKKYLENFIDLNKIILPKYDAYQDPTILISHNQNCEIYTKSFSYLLKSNFENVFLRDKNNILISNFKTSNVTIDDPIFEYNLKIWRYFEDFAEYLPKNLKIPAKYLNTKAKVFCYQIENNSYIIFVSALLDYKLNLLLTLIEEIILNDKPRMYENFYINKDVAIVL
jgi:hypothetical protein